MLKLENTEVFGWEAAIRGMRNPMNSWNKSDSRWGCVPGHTYPTCGEDCRYECEYIIGENDLKLMKSLSKAGNDHAKFLRMINVTVDITAPFYWWKEFDTYKVGTVANSCSTMHKIHEKELTLEDFSHEHLTGETDGLWVNADGRDFMCSALDFCQITCDVLNHYRELYLKTKYKKYWLQMIQLLPSSYNQKRTVQFNYQVLKSMYFARKDHKLDEWHILCDWMLNLPYFKEVCVQEYTHPNCGARMSKEEE